MLVLLFLLEVFCFFNFLTVLGVPINDSICFSMMNGDKLVIDCSSSDFMTKNLGKLSVDLKIVEASVSSSESGRCLLFFELVCCSVGKFS